MTLPETPTRTALRAEVDAQFVDIEDRLEELESDSGVPAHTHPTGDITGFNAAVDARAQAKIDALLGAAPAALDTLVELAAALGNDASYSTTINNALAALTTSVNAKQAGHANLTGVSSVGDASEMVVFKHGGAWVRRTLAEFKAMLGIIEGGGSEPRFNIESHGAVADGTTDNYAALLAAWNAMLAFAKTGSVYGPTIDTYRFALTPQRVQVWPDKQYAAFPIPMVLREPQNLKHTFGIRGEGNAYTVRAAELAGEPAQVASATVFFFDYDPSLFTWDATDGHPSIFGAPDADATDPVGNTFSNLGFQVNNIILRSPDNPSLCVLNLEQVSTCTLDNVRFDVETVLDFLPEPTRPTGCALLLPRSNNNVAIDVGKIIIEGYYGGMPLTEHLLLNSAIVLACKIGAFTRRPCSHITVVSGQLKIEQCQWGFAGYAPDGAAPNLGVVDFKGGVYRIGAVDIEHYGYDGDPERAWRYTPNGYADILDRNGTLNGTIAAMYRINSENPPVGTTNNATIIVTGPNGTVESPIAAFRIHNHTVAMTRVLGGVPSNPPIAPPNAPTIGVATAGIESASIAFTPAGAGEPATGFTATAYNGSAVAVGDQDGSASPIVITGLAAGVEVTVKVKASNSIGDSAESAASNAVTPSSSGGPPSDNFNRSNAASLGNSSSGHAYQGDPQGTWEIIGNRAEANLTGTAFNPVWLDSGETQQVITAVIRHRVGERGLLGRVVDAANNIMMDYEYSGTSANIAIYERVANSLTPRGGGSVVSDIADDSEVELKLVLDGTNARAYVRKIADAEGAPRINTTLDGSAPNGTGAGFYSLVTGTPHTVFDDFAVAEVTP